MSFKEAIANFRPLKEKSQLILSESKLKIELSKLEDRYGFSIQPPPLKVEVEKVYKKLLLSLTQDSRVVGFDFSNPEWDLVPWAFVCSINGNIPLFENENFTPIVFSEIKNKVKYGAISSFIQVFLSEYPSGARGFQVLRENIQKIIFDSENRKIDFIKQWVDSTGILNANAPQLCAKQIISTDFASTFSNYRLRKGLEFSQFSLVTIGSLLGYLGEHLGDYESKLQLKIINDVTKNLINEVEELKFPSLRVAVADGLLSSFFSREATRDVKNKLRDFFLERYGDPRLSKVQWLGVDEDALAVMNNLMVENTLQDFFNLLSHVAKTDRTADRHWKYRKRFWNAYLKKGYIQEAWVALGPRAYANAKDFLGGDNAYARLSGALPNHSALIMVINDVLITEWTHSGRYRLWVNSLNRPGLYDKEYFRLDLVNFPDHEGNHSASDSGGWQSTLSRLIHQLTGVKVKREEYMND